MSCTTKFNEFADPSVASCSVGIDSGEAFYTVGYGGEKLEQNTNTLNLDGATPSAAL